jgi:hypothetical protein
MMNNIGLARKEVVLGYFLGGYYKIQKSGEVVIDLLID